MATELLKLLRTQLEDIDAGWSIGSFGAIGEFHQRPDDVLTVNDSEALIRATEKGGIRIYPNSLNQIETVAYETLSPRAHRWSQGVVFCLPEKQALMNQRSVLTELGKDSQAIRSEHRKGILFDMGLAQTQIDFCIRTDNPELIAILRENEGKSLQAPGNPAMMAILKSHPHRVVLSKLGRVEVYQKIGGPDTGGVSPDGPHTHVLPKLLKAGRTHSANVPVPEGYIPCASLHPASPVMGPAGEDIPFHAERYDAFLSILQAYGRSEYLDARNGVMQAFNEFADVDSFTTPETRVGRTAVKNTLRQIRRIGEWDNDSRHGQWLDAWQTRFDRVIEQDDADDELIGHQGAG